MIGYVTLGTNQYEKAVAFYDELLALLGATRFMDGEYFTAWSAGPNTAGLCVIKPHDGQAASVGNGTMVALAVQTSEQVQQVYAKALALGGSDEGAPGPRGDAGFYAGYFRDLDGNKLNAFCMASAG